MSLVIADSRPESLTLIAAQHEDWIIQQAITLLENRVFKAGPALGSPAAVRDYLIAAGVAPVVRLSQIFRQAARSMITTAATRMIFLLTGTSLSQRAGRRQPQAPAVQA